MKYNRRVVAYLLAGVAVLTALLAFALVNKSPKEQTETRTAFEEYVSQEETDRTNQNLETAEELIASTDARDSIRGWLQKANILKMAKDYDGGLRVVQQAIESWPNADAILRYQLVVAQADLASLKGEYAEAARLIREWDRTGLSTTQSQSLDTLLAAYDAGEQPKPAGCEGETEVVSCR